MGAVQDAIAEPNFSQNQLEARLPPPSFKKYLLGHLPRASGVDTGVSALLSGGLCCTDGDTSPSEAEGAGTTIYDGGGEKIIVLGLGDADGSLPVIFSGIGADAGGGNVTGGCNKGPKW